MTISQPVSTSESIDPGTTLGEVTLVVADAERSLKFYRDFLGFQVLRHEGQQIALGVEQTPLLKLIVQPGARPKPRRATGLYHVAILLPSRLHLAQVLYRLLEVEYRMGASDHLVSEALYLDDPDGNGLEIYRDRPRTEWQWSNDGEIRGEIRMDTLPLDYKGVLDELENANEAWRGMPAGTRIGHIHLQVGNLKDAEAFYHGVLGFDVTTYYPGALFLSAGGYHHHIGTNIWNSANVPLPPADVIGLRSFVVQLPNANTLAQTRIRIENASWPLREQDDALALAVNDPWRNTVLLKAAPSAVKP